MAEQVCSTQYYEPATFDNSGQSDKKIGQTNATHLSLNKRRHSGIIRYCDNVGHTCSLCRLLACTAFDHSADILPAASEDGSREA